jgi:HEAT repeat protein
MPVHNCHLGWRSGGGFSHDSPHPTVASNPCRVALDGPPAYAAGMAPARRWRASSWLVAVASALAGLLLAAAGAWWWLPAWAPGWVAVNSPWPEPVLRAALAQSQEPSDQEMVLLEWIGHDPEARCAALERFLVPADPVRVRLVTAALRDDASVVKPASLVARLVGLASHPDPIIREQAIGAIARMADPALAEVFFKAMHDPARDVAAAACSAWMCLSPGDDAVRRAFDDPRGDVRCAAIALLQGRVDADAYALVHRALRDADGTVRYLAITDLGRFKEADDEAALLDSLGRTSDELVVVAINALVRYPSPAVRRALVALTATSASAARRGAAIAALASIAEPEDGPALVRALAEADPKVRRTAVAGLGAMDDVDAIPALAAMTDDRDPEVAQRVEVVLQRLRARAAALAR